MSSPASVAGALRRTGASLGPGRSWCHRQRTGRAAPGRTWRLGLAQVAQPWHCFLPGRNFFWVCCRVKGNWCWCCRREVLRVPVADQPLAGQRAHGVVSALGRSECHRYVPRWPRTPVNEMSPQRLCCCCICCSEGLGILPRSSRISVWIFCV